MDKWIKVDQYSQIKVDKYNDTYSILSGSQGQDDVVYRKFCAPQIWKSGKKLVFTKNGEPVFVPWDLSLGKDRSKAVEILKHLIDQVERL